MWEVVSIGNIYDYTYILRAKTHLEFITNKDMFQKYSGRITNKMNIIFQTWKI